MVDQQTKKGSFNGSFLVLNLGTNTLEVGNSFKHPRQSESLQQITKDTTPRPLNEINNAFNEVSSSTEEGSFSTSETSRSKRGSEGEEDPDWVPEKKARKSSNSANRTVKQKQGPSVSSNPPQISVGGSNEMLNLSSGLPPPHLMNLLGIFGWKMVLQPGKSDYVYISPTGLPYFSLQKAFETFLQGTSKYREKASFSFSYLENSSLGGSLVQKAAASSSYLGAGSENATDGSRKKPRRRRKKNSNVEEYIKLAESVEEQLQPKDDPFIDNGKKSLRMADTVECQEASRASSLCKVNEKTKCYAEDRCLNNKFNQAVCSPSLANEDSLCGGILSRPGRSGQMSGRNVENEMNVLSGSGVWRDKAKDKEQNPISQLDNVLKERTKACKVDNHLNNEARNSDCSPMSVMRSCQSRRRSSRKARRSVGLRRSGRLNKKDDVLDKDLDTEKQAECSYPINTKSACRTSKSLVPESVLNEKTDCSTSDERLHGETKRSECSSTFFLSESNANDMNGYHDTTGIRRSMRINGKHVPVDDDSDLETGFDDYFSYPSEFGANIVVNKDKEKQMTSPFEIDDEGGNAASDDMPKQMSMNTCCQNSSFEKSSASLKDKSVEILVSDKCSSSFAAEGKLVGGGNFNRRKQKKRRGGCGLTVRRIGKNDHQEEILSQTKINILSWLIDSGTLTENERVYYIATNGTGNTPGIVTRGGIWCNCCKELVPLSKFVAHAGGKNQQPWNNIFLLSGKTLLWCLKEVWEKEKVQKKIVFRTVGVGDPDPSDDTCGICADGGHLICCDSCPSTFHQTCLMLKTLPEGSWYCPYCICTFCMAVARGSGNLLSCKQCGRRYHKNCAWENNMDLLGSVPFSFCGKNCQKMATELSDILGIKYPIEEGFSWTLLKRFDEDARIISDQRLSFIMESNVKLSMALSVLNECFVPLVDQRTGVDMICQAIYNCGSNFNRLNYERFYTLILERDEEIISAATLRLHGTSLAEMPFIGTRTMYRRQGMCRRLLKAVEDILCSLNVEKLIIPAIPDLLETWTTSFSFKPLEPYHREEAKNLSLMVFAETTLLQKSMHRKPALLQEDVKLVVNGVSCAKNIKESDELQRSFGNQISTRNPYGSGSIIQESHELQSSFGDQIYTRDHSGSVNNMKENHELQRSSAEQINTRSHVVDNGSSYGENIQGSYELQKSFGDPINTRSHFGIGENIQEGHGLQRSFPDQINSRSHFIDNGVSYGENIQHSHEVQRSFGNQINSGSDLVYNCVNYEKTRQDSHELQRSFGNQTNTRSHFGSGKNIQNSHEVQISYGNQINSGSHLVDSHVGYEKNIQDNPELHRSFGNQTNTRSHFRSGCNIQESHEVQTPFGQQINQRGHVGNGLLRSCSEQINDANYFGGAPDWWIYECILKGQTDSASELCRILKDSSTAPDSLAILPPNLNNGSVSEVSHPRQSFMKNHSTVSYNPTAVAHGPSAVPPRNICNESIPETWHKHTSATNLCPVPHNLAASITPDSSAVMPANISNRSISNASPFQCTFSTNTTRASLTADNAPGSLDVLPPKISNGPVSKASPLEQNVMSNLSTVHHNPTTSSPPSIDVVLDGDYLGMGNMAAANSGMNSQSQSADEVKNLQMDAIRSSISFDNLLRAVFLNSVDCCKENLGVREKKAERKMRFGTIKILAPLPGKDGANYRKLGAAMDILLLCASVQEGRASEPTTVVNY